MEPKPQSGKLRAASEEEPAFTEFPAICQMRRGHNVGVGREERPGKGPEGEAVERGIL